MATALLGPHHTLCVLLPSCSMFLSVFLSSLVRRFINNVRWIDEGGARVPQRTFLFLSSSMSFPRYREYSLVICVCLCLASWMLWTLLLFVLLLQRLFQTLSVAFGTYILYVWIFIYLIVRVIKRLLNTSESAGVEINILTICFFLFFLF